MTPEQRAHARQLDQLMVKTFGPDYREKAIVNAGGSFSLQDAFAECGLEDPMPPSAPPAGGFGLWQMAPYRAPVDPGHGRASEKTLRDAGLIKPFPAPGD